MSFGLFYKILVYSAESKNKSLMKDKVICRRCLIKPKGNCSIRKQIAEEFYLVHNLV